MSAPPVQLSPVEVAAQMRQRAEYMQRMLREAQGLYTSKRRLQAIAIGAVSTLAIMYDAAAQAAEAQAAEQAAQSGLILPPEGIIVP